MQRQDSPIITKTFRNLKTRIEQSSSWVTENTSSDSDTVDFFSTKRKKKKQPSLRRKAPGCNKLAAGKPKIPMGSPSSSEALSPIFRNITRLADSSPEVPRDDKKISPELDKQTSQISQETVQEAVGPISDTRKRSPPRLRHLLEIPSLNKHRLQVKGNRKVPSEVYDLVNSTCVEGCSKSDLDKDWNISSIPRFFSSSSVDSAVEGSKGCRINSDSYKIFSKSPQATHDYSNQPTYSCKAPLRIKPDKPVDTGHNKSELTGASEDSSRPRQTADDKNKDTSCKILAAATTASDRIKYTSRRGLAAAVTAPDRTKDTSQQSLAVKVTAADKSRYSSRHNRAAATEGIKDPLRGSREATLARKDPPWVEDKNKVPSSRFYRIAADGSKVPSRPSRAAAVTASDRLKICAKIDTSNSKETIVPPLEEKSGLSPNTVQDNRKTASADTRNTNTYSSQSEHSDFIDNIMKSKHSRDKSRLSRKKKKSSYEEEEDVIVITDDESSSGLDKKERKKSTDNGASKHLMTYKDIPVDENDYRTLEEGEFLNDNIIQFYLTYLKEEVLSEKDRKNVYVFSTHFFSSLTKSRKNEDPTLTEEQRRYKRVERWTKHIDLFEKDMIVFPICEESHWYLIIAVKPKLIQITKTDQPVKGQPFFIMLDSMGGRKERSVGKIRHYLAAEWNSKTNGTETFSGREMKLLAPQKPEQQNFYDCGVYLLHYVEKIFGQVTKFYWKNFPSLAEWFPQEEIDRKRYQLAQLIQKLSKDQKGDTIQFPKIRLNKEAKRSRRRRARMTYDEDPFDPLVPDDQDEMLMGKSRSLRVRKQAPRNNPRPKRKLNDGHDKKTDKGTSQEQDSLLRLQQRLQGKYKIPRKQGNLKPDEIGEALNALNEDEDEEAADMSEEENDGMKSETKVAGRDPDPDPGVEPGDAVSSDDQAKSSDKENTEVKDKDRAVIDPSTRKVLPPGEVPCVTEQRKQFHEFLDKEKPDLKVKSTIKEAQVNREGFNNFLKEKSRKSVESKILAEYDPQKYKDEASLKSKGREKTDDLPESRRLSTSSTCSHQDQPSTSSRNARSSPRNPNLDKSPSKRQRRYSEKVNKLRSEWSESSELGEANSPTKTSRMRDTSRASQRSSSPPFYPRPPSRNQTETKEDQKPKRKEGKQEVSSAACSKKKVISKLSGKKLKYPRSIDAKINHLSSGNVRKNPGKDFKVRLFSARSSTDTPPDSSFDLSR